MSDSNLESAKYFGNDQSSAKPPLKGLNLGEGSGFQLMRLLPLLILIGAGAACWMAYQRADYFAITAALLVMLGALNGFHRGFVGMLVSTFAVGVAIYLAPQIGVHLESMVSEKLGTTGLLKNLIATAVGGLAVFAGFNLVSSLVLRLMLGKPNRNYGFNNLFGSVVGGAHVAAALALFLVGYSMVEPTVEESLATRKANASAADETETNDTASEEIGLSFNADEVLTKLADGLKTSELRAWFDANNPIQQVPGLNKINEFQQSLGQLNDGKAVKQLLQHPSIKVLRQEPEMKAAVQQLVGEPEIVALLQSQEKFGPAALSTLLRSDAVLNLLKQPKFLSTAQEILGSKEQQSSSEITTKYTSVQPDA